MNPYNYKAFYLVSHQDLMAEAAEARLAKLAQGEQAKTYRRFPKFLDDILQKIDQKFIGLGHQPYPGTNRLNPEKMNG